MTSAPIRLWSLKVPATGEIVALEELGIPLNVSITMAAIDPTEEVKGDGPKLSTLRILHQQMMEPEIGDYDSDESIDSDLASGESDSEEEDDDDESSEEEEEVKPKAIKGKKGAAAKDDKKKAVVVGKKQADESEEDDDDEDDEDFDVEDLMVGDDDDEDDIEEVVVCTLDPTKTYQQPLQLTVGDGEPVFFKATGAYTIYLTGNYVTEPRPTPPSYDDSDEEEDDLYDDEDDEDDEGEMDLDDLLARIKASADDEDDSDSLDDLDDPRITELDDDEEAPALVATKKPEETLTKKEKAAAAKAAQLKAKAAETQAAAIIAAVKDGKKRTADEMDIDTVATSETLANGATVTTAATTVTSTSVDTPPSSLSKKQQKKLKANSGEAVPVANSATSTPTEKKKVQFASQLEQGPTPNGNKSPAAPVEKAAASPSAKSRTVDGVKIEDHKVGSGQEAKKGNKVAMRYIGKLTNGNMFDSNKKGKPFSFQLGKGEVIKGWDIGIAGMKVGGERKLVIPPNLAYGNKSLPGIPKNSTLVFEVKLLEIK